MPTTHRRYLMILGIYLETNYVKSIGELLIGEREERKNNHHTTACAVVLRTKLRVKRMVCVETAKEYLQRVAKEEVNSWSEDYDQLAAKMQEYAVLYNMNKSRKGELAIEGLSALANPVGYLKKQAEQEGMVFEPVQAHQMCSDANFLKDLAVSLLKETEEEIPVPEPLYRGAYVLACKYPDADPNDHWAVGFIKGMVKKGRYDVTDGCGTSMRGNGFREARLITRTRGGLILALTKGDFYRWYPKNIWTLANMSLEELKELVQDYQKMSKS